MTLRSVLNDCEFSLRRNATNVSEELTFLPFSIFEPPSNLHGDKHGCYRSNYAGNKLLAVVSTETLTLLHNIATIIYCIVRLIIFHTHEGMGRLSLPGCSSIVSSTQRYRTIPQF